MSYESEQSAVSRIWGAFGNCDDYRDLELTRVSHKSFAAGELTVTGQHADRWVAKPLENKWDCLIGTLRLTGYKTANFQRPWCCSCAPEMLASGLVQDQRRERSLWSLEAQVCRCQLKKEAFSPYYSYLFLFYGCSKQLVYICVSFSGAMMQSYDNGYPKINIVQKFSGSHLFPLCTAHCGSTMS